jgi:hypothetical protein
MLVEQLTAESAKYMAISFVICIVLTVLLQPWKNAVWRYWLIAAVFTIGGVAATMHTVSTASSTNNLATARGEVTRSAEETLQILKTKMNPSEKCIIPTGVQVQGFKFETSLDLAMHGYIWQTYPKSCPDKIRGYTVPEAGDGGFQRRELRRELMADGSEKVLYQFQTTQRQVFNYERYPFDYQTLWLRLWSLDFDGSVVLVPDFESYPKWEDNLKLGIDPDAEIGGFALDFTQWTIFFPPTKTSFGLKKFEQPPDRVGLYYNVGFHRLMVGPLVNHLLPTMVIIFLTFAALMFVHTDQDRATAVLSFLGALLFAAIFNHQGIRASVSAAGFTTVGLYSIISYALLLLVSVNTIIIAKTDISWFERYDNLFTKALFMPVTAWVFAAVTHYALLAR